MGTSRIVTVEYDALGGETGVGFSLNFDASRLSYVSASLAPGVPLGSFFQLNTLQIQQGRLGLGVILPTNRVFSPGTHQIFAVTFQVPIATVQGTTSIGFGDVPIPRQVLQGTQNLPLNLITFAGGTVNIEASYEGDTAHRPSGNGTLSLADWVQTGRLAVGLDMTSSPSEFQRTDCAPSGTRGDGVLSLADWVQAGRYATGIDPITPSGGPSGPSAFTSRTDTIAPSTSSFERAPKPGGSAILVASPALRKGVAHVVMSIEAKGIENALSFTFAFDADRWEFVGAQPGWHALNGTLLLGRSNLAAGKVSIALALPPGLAVSRGWRQVVEAKFRAIGKRLAGSPRIRLVNDGSATCTVVDVVANEVHFECGTWDKRRSKETNAN